MPTTANGLAKKITTVLSRLNMREFARSIKFLKNIAPTTNPKVFAIKSLVEKVPTIVMACVNSMAKDIAKQRRIPFIKVCFLKIKGKYKPNGVKANILSKKSFLLNRAKGIKSYLRRSIKFKPFSFL